MRYLFVFLSLLPILVNAQNSMEHDTIYVNNGTSYLIFEDDILGYGFGDTELFRGNVFENSFHIRSNKKLRNSVTSLLVTYGSPEMTSYYFAYVCYKPAGVIREFYDLRTTTEEKRKKVSDSVEVSRVQFLAQEVLASGDEIKSTGIKGNDYAIFLRMVRADEKHFYLKFAFDNKSAVDYIFDHISYQYVQKYKASALSSTKTNKSDVFPRYTTNITSCKAYSKTYYVTAIPVFALSESEVLLVTFREKKGDRTYKLEIPSNVLRNAKRL